MKFTLPSIILFGFISSRRTVKHINFIIDKKQEMNKNRIMRKLCLDENL